MDPVLLTAGDVVAARARLEPDVVGVRDIERSLTNAAWNSRSCQLANGLLGLGLAKGDRVAVLAYNRVEWAEIYVACAKAGLVALPINFRLTGPEIAYIVNDASASALIIEDALLDVVGPVRADLPIPNERCLWLAPRNAPSDQPPDGYRGYEVLVAGNRSTEPAVDVGPGDLWCLMYTSGTTGKPKGAMRSHRGMAMIAFATGIEFQINRDDTALLVMPLCHANSLNFLTSFLYGGAAISIFSRPSFDADLCLTQLAEATFSSLVPTHYAMMLDVPAGQRPDTGSIRKLLVSSANVFPETKRRIMEMFPSAGLYELYGSTEAGWVTMLHPHEQFEHLGSVGREVVGTAPIRLLDDAGNEVPDGQPGELFSCSPQHFDGYWNLPDKTAEGMRGQYLSVGDVARRNEHGFIELIDRKKNMIVSGGENVYPSEVEEVLAAHPDVGDVAVVGMPDAVWSERVEAVVVPRPGTTPNAEQLLEWAKPRLAGFKRPRAVHFVKDADMPRTATGKIQHQKLRQQLTTGAEEA